MTVPAFAKATRTGWVAVTVLFAVLMVLGSQRDSSPATPQERVESIARRLACPTCDGESVSESRGAASQAIRQEIARLVSEGGLDDDEIVTTIDDSYAENLQLTPGSSGLDVLVWVLPIVVGALALIGLIAAFRRWQDSASRDRVGPVDEVDRPDRTSRAVLGLVGVVLVVVLVSVAVVRNTGDRRPGQGMTGGGDQSGVSALLVEARSLGMADLETALGLYAQVLEQEPRNVEALTYFGWLTVLSASQIEDQELAGARLESGLVLLRQATVVDATYPDAHCFLGISFFRFLGDAQAASPEIDTCLESDPPSEVAVLVEELAQQIDEALAASSSSPSDTVGTEPPE